MTARLLLLPMLGMLIACGGCVKIRENIVLRGDGSGYAELNVAFLQLGLRFLPGKPNAEWVRTDLPPNVTLDSFENDQQPTTFTDADGKEHDLINEVYEIRISFDHIEALNRIRVAPDNRNAAAAAAGGAPGNDRMDAMVNRQRNDRPAIGPFQRLEFHTDGDLVHFQRVVQSARDPSQIEAAEMRTPGSNSQTQVVDLTGAMLVVTMECPGEVVEHNANEADGRTLTWTFLFADLQEQQDRDWTIEFTCRLEENE